jgi:hypothetical protein
MCEATEHRRKLCALGSALGGARKQVRVGCSFNGEAEWTRNFAGLREQARSSHKAGSGAALELLRFRSSGELAEHGQEARGSVGVVESVQIDGREKVG